jgi:DNA-binding NtrC family response regulator
MNLEKLASPDTDGVPLSAANILIIDDEPLMRALIGRYIESIARKSPDLSISYTSFENGWDLLQAPLENVKVAIVDILLPKVTGVDLIKNFRKRFPQMGIIPITGMATDPMKRQLTEHLPQGSAILEKPLRLEEFEKAFLDSFNFARERAKNAGLVLVPNAASFTQEEPSWRAINAKEAKEVVSVKKKFRRNNPQDDGK